MIKHVVIFILSFLFYNNFIVAQKVDFNENGLNVLQVGVSVKELTNIKFKEMSHRPDLNYQVGIVDFKDSFQYYYIVSDSMYVEQGGLLKDIFFAVDKSEKIRGIILIFEEFSEDIIPVINAVFGSANIKSKSGNGEKSAWKKNNVSLLLSVYSSNTKITITNTALEENSPGVHMSIYRSLN